jgi:DNA-binding NarL/FixJ family response regulator
MTRTADRALDDRMNVTTQNRAVDGWESLTQAEIAVADLVALGLTNRDVGAELFLSHHTVDAHLRQIFRKLHITSRVMLARLSVERRSVNRSLYVISARRRAR